MTEDTPQSPVETRGPTPYATERHYLIEGKRYVWRARDHRRGLRHVLRPAGHTAWRPERLNTPIGWGFVVGSLLFALCALLALQPGLSAALGLSEEAVNTGFFVGSIFFTTAAYLQLYQAANAGAQHPHPVTPPPARVLFGWKPDDIGWLASALQFVGTLLFNISTAAALHPSGNWLRDDLVIWVPDIFGSILFLSSGYLAYAEASHGYWSLSPKDLSWQVVATNLAGCVAFMISAFYAFVPPAGQADAMVQHSVFWTLIGAVFFAAGAGLMLRESATLTPQAPLPA
ncbi:MAG: hypothetical protein AAGB05_09215 [Pseudomonadota bacterium]